MRCQFALVLALLAPLCAQDWPQYHGAEHDRRSPESIELSTWPDAGPPIAWKVATDAGFSSFSVVGDRVFTLVNRDDSEALVALSVKDGKELWSASLAGLKYDPGGGAGAADNRGGDGPRSTAAADDSHVYTFDAALVLRCHEIETGKLVWKRDLIADHKGRSIRWQNAASPVLEGDLIFVAGGGAGESLMAVRKLDGSIAWAKGDELMTHATPIVATIHGERQVIFYVQSGLVALATKSGREIWRAPFTYRTSSASSPVVYEDIVYVSAGYGVGAGAFRITKNDDGCKAELLWRKRNKLINHWSTPVCRDGYLYGMFSFKKYGKGPLCCVSIETGDTEWVTPGFGPGNAIAVGDTLVALADNGEVVLVELNHSEYKELARAAVVEGKCWSSPSFSRGQLYIRSTEQGVRIDLTSTR